MAIPDEILAAAERVRGDGPSKPRSGRDPVNMPMIRNWLEAIGDENPIYTDSDAAVAAGHGGLVAPPAMAQVWTMRGLGAQREADDPLGRMTGILDDAGYTSVVATNCDQVYHRYLRPGEEVTIESTLEDVVGPKKTGLGEGWFFTTRNIWKVGDEIVAEMLFRILKFAPPAKETAPAADAPVVPEDLDPARLLRPSASQDTQFFWDGVAAHELRIQRRPDGSLQHPPVAALWLDRTETTDYVVASGRGTVFSYVVHHAPKVPGRSLPFVVALVELEESAGGERSDGSRSIRMLGELRGVDPADVRIGMPVEVTYLDFPGDDETGGEPWTLYAWTPRQETA
ncbi:bifunctional MaoC family dehydratase N-terminal/OB-fold nucleic acid binding domain-containing protein [Rhodococcus zopfii]|uniref:DNA-binding protein n=1 Tax=Rhodococcus zopfii TaxID=43772 RepID=A0ABU3WSM4_9NOCA|nr:DNA-binding protein [Rhodococcus zopfii]